MALWYLASRPQISYKEQTKGMGEFGYKDTFAGLGVFMYKHGGDYFLQAIPDSGTERITMQFLNRFTNDLRKGRADDGCILKNPAQ